MSTFEEISFVGAQGVHDMLRQFMDPILTKRAQRATKAGANVLKAPLREAVSQVTPGHSQRMAASVYVHVAKRDKPAYVVGHHVRTAFFWHFLIGGTKAHVAGRGIRVSGIKAHPVVDKVASEYGGQALEAVMTDLAKDS